MPASGLPKALETSLSSLMRSNTLLLWKINGGENNVTVTLMFNDEDNGTGTASYERYYKKMPPLALESALVTLMGNNKLTTWKISGSNNQVMAILLFKKDNTKAKVMTDSVYYKKAVPIRTS